MWIGVTRIEDARLYVSTLLCAEFRKRLTPRAYYSLSMHLVRAAALADRWVSGFSRRELAQFPADLDPPWAHAEVLLRTWQELCALGERDGM